MSVVCPGMSGFILNPKASKRTKQIVAGMLEVCLGMSVVCPGMSGYDRVHSNPKDVLALKNSFWRLCRRYVWVCRWYVRVSPVVSVPLERFSAQNLFDGYARDMSGYVGGMSGYVRVCPVVSVTLVRFSAQKTDFCGYA